MVAVAGTYAAIDSDPSCNSNNQTDAVLLHLCSLQAERICSNIVDPSSTADEEAQLCSRAAYSVLSKP